MTPLLVQKISQSNPTLVSTVEIKASIDSDSEFYDRPDNRLRSMYYVRRNMSWPPRLTGGNLLQVLGGGGGAKLLQDAGMPLF